MKRYILTEYSIGNKGEINVVYIFTGLVTINLELSILCVYCIVFFFY